MYLFYEKPLWKKNVSFSVKKLNMKIIYCFCCVLLSFLSCEKKSDDACIYHYLNDKIVISEYRVKNRDGSIDTTYVPTEKIAGKEYKFVDTINSRGHASVTYGK